MASSPEASLESILRIITTLNDRVSSLSVGLRAVEGRVSRLEAATFTPATSPTLRNSTPGHVNEMPARPVHVEPAELPAPDHIAPMYTSNYASSQNVDHSSVRRQEGQDEALHERDQASTLKRQLQPINDGIDALTKHLLRIEDAISSSHAKPSPKPGPGPRCCEMCGWPAAKQCSEWASQASPASAILASPPGPSSSSTLPKPSKLRRSPVQVQTTGQDKPANIDTINHSPHPSPHRPIFGQPSIPSTPGRRDLSLNISGSPYTSYTDDQSPFAQLASRSTSSSSVLGFKPRFPPMGFQGLTQKGSEVFGTPGSGGVSLRGGGGGGGGGGGPPVDAGSKPGSLMESYPRSLCSGRGACRGIVFFVRGNTWDKVENLRFENETTWNGTTVL
ncbi:hypothetical protein K491DRAFT_676050 [Lophiostoma macrostomum CBS 122681]|uniref:Uncharacterized protein n=1 Tax=Lophiostoma macrostomum CBS 122681 TaxID=1314788 RepID=A0A6A6THH5_9PLEO|nr:hypothetical protein K491DRAFT_676050 [Lophiostoma macrostomum CBS 122681]